MYDKPILDNTNPTALEQFKQRVKTLFPRHAMNITVVTFHEFV